MKTLKDLTLKEVENLCEEARLKGSESDNIFLNAFVPDKEQNLNEQQEDLMLEQSREKDFKRKSEVD